MSLRFLQTTNRKEAGAIDFDSHPGNDKWKKVDRGSHWLIAELSIDRYLWNDKSEMTDFTYFILQFIKLYKNFFLNNQNFEIESNYLQLQFNNVQILLKISFHFFWNFIENIYRQSKIKGLNFIDILHSKKKKKKYKDTRFSIKTFFQILKAAVKYIPRVKNINSEQPKEFECRGGRHASGSCRSLVKKPSDMAACDRGEPGQRYGWV